MWIVSHAPAFAIGVGSAVRLTEQHPLGQTVEGHVVGLRAVERGMVEFWVKGCWSENAFLRVPISWAALGLMGYWWYRFAEPWLLRTETPSGPPRPSPPYNGNASDASSSTAYPRGSSVLAVAASRSSLTTPDLSYWPSFGSIDNNAIFTFQCPDSQSSLSSVGTRNTFGQIRGEMPGGGQVSE